MKDKILTLIIGILIGAILATGGFFIYEKINGDNKKEMPSMQGEGQMQAPGNGEQPPEKPGNDNGELPQMSGNSINAQNTTSSNGSNSNSSINSNT